MKTLILFLICTLLIACQASQENVKETTLQGSKSVGKKIDTDVAYRWISNYKQQDPNGRTDVPYSISQENLKSMLHCNSPIVGVSFHNALDDEGKYHILVIPVDESLSIWASPNTSVFVDANSDTPINKNIALKWTKNYKAVYPGKVEYHFFGVDIFGEIIKSPQVEIEQAISDENDPVLILLVRHHSNGARTTDGGTVIAYDYAELCPPLCKQ